MKISVKQICPLFLAIALFLPAFSSAQNKAELYINTNPKHEVRIPDIPGYQTLVCDFHTHTVFSDGMVWPTVRVQEAWREGLDALAITDHIEYQPHKNDLPTNHNRPYELVNESAKQLNILLPRGAEITRETPPGHYNAIFVKDIVPIDTEEFLDAVRRANEQNGFVFWNHPGWKGIERGRWREIHDTMKKNKWLHGIEVSNGETYYPEAHRYAMEHDLTMMGTSDIHQPALGLPRKPDRHRTTTLVFVKERTLPAIKEALFAHRTVAWYKNSIIGRKEWVQPVFEASLEIRPPHYQSKDTYWFELHNKAEIDLILERTSDLGPKEVTVPAKSTIQVRLKTEQDLDKVRLSYNVTNFLIAPETPLSVTLSIPTH